MSAAEVAAQGTAEGGEQDADLERRFGGLRRLYGDAGYARLRAARVAVVGVGGVGSWTAEALARSGVAALTLIDFDHVAESNVNRQVQALGSTLGASKVLALKARIADIHPGCSVHAVEAFVEDENWTALLPASVDALADCCDQSRAKLLLARWALKHGLPFVSVGAAGGKTHAQDVEVDDLARVTHDPLLASLRSKLRKHAGVSASRPLGLRCVFSRETVSAPAGDSVDGSLNCAGYGSSVTVTATFGFVAAGELLRQVLAQPAGQGESSYTARLSETGC